VFFFTINIYCIISNYFDLINFTKKIFRILFKNLSKNVAPSILPIEVGLLKSAMKNLWLSAKSKSIFD